MNEEAEDTSVSPTPTFVTPRPDDEPISVHFKWGIVGTGLYLLALLVLGIISSDALLDLTPNEFGDLLAGIFSPLAFLWLVLGFMQQGVELRQSSRALWLQGQELQNSVTQQRDLVAVTREQLNFERDARTKLERDAELSILPTLVLHIQAVHRDSSGDRYHFQLSNSGTACTLLEIYFFENLHKQCPSLATDDVTRFSLTFSDNVTHDVPVTVKFRDRRGRKVSQRFVLTPTGKGRPSQLSVFPEDPIIDHEL